MDYITIEDAAKKWGVPLYIVKQLCKLGQIPHADRSGAVPVVPRDAVYPLQGYLSVSQAAKKWRIEKAVVRSRCTDGTIAGAKHIGYDWYIPKDAPRPGSSVMKHHPGYLTVRETAEKWGVTKSAVHAAARRGRIPHAALIDGLWYIPAAAQCPSQAANMRRVGFLSAAESAKKWGVSVTYVYDAARTGRIPGAEFVNGRWFLPEDARSPAERPDAI